MSPLPTFIQRGCTYFVNRRGLTARSTGPLSAALRAAERSVDLVSLRRVRWRISDHRVIV